MNFEEEIGKIKERLSGAQEVLVMINKNPNIDSVAAALALHLGLQKLGKKVFVFCEDKIKVEFGNLVAVNKITDSLGGKNFIISLDYKEGSIDKVSYNIENDKFNLVIESRPEAPQLTSENVHYSYSGATADLVFVIDASHPADLGKVYEEKKELFSEDKLINISRSQPDENFAKINLVVSQAASTSEIIAFFLEHLGVKPDQDMASNLLAGIEFGSNNFTSPSTNAVTFEMAALALRAGGKRISSPQAQPSKKVAFFPEEKKEERKEERREEKKEVKKEEKKEEKKPPIAPSFAKASEDKKGTEDKGEKAPPDWLKPKIYKGSTLL